MQGRPAELAVVHQEIFAAGGFHHLALDLHDLLILVES